jgi:signal peptidase II
MGFYLIALAVVLTDQVTKAMVIRFMRLGQGIPIIPGYFDLTFVLNPGAAFSLLATLPEGIRNPFFIGISVTAAVLIILYRSRYLRQHRLASASLGLSSRARLKSAMPWSYCLFRQWACPRLL